MALRNLGNPYHDTRGRFTSGPSKASGLSDTGNNRLSSSPKGRPMSQAEVDAHAAHAMDQYRQELAHGLPPADAAAWAANSEVESQGDPARHQIGGGPGRGLFQWGSDRPAYDRRIDFQNRMHIPIDQASAKQQRDFRDFELNNKFKPARNHINAATTVAGKARAISNFYIKPYERIYNADNRARIAVAIIRNAGEK